ncbi:MBL fold metallo-hydrolase RNA specificity domain-containing protein [Shewanella glacialimarina]|uniref:MBL fold metallo-hydrolase RNA specificity domain-containing protein n=1 Tax=Shewanella glacialimarina TaxID=2590884 RepID=UPI001CF80C0C|nr:MBL fold metallo-hydrolase [Shewanella glacialimarina]UCX04002.1 MBL fold metallo-hydrolase [Shewanella glacialimarina]
MQILHHGAVNGVTGSCHQLDINETGRLSSYLIDCGLFQGAETAGKSSAQQLQIEFDISAIQALIVTHCHIDHVGRIPYLIAAGFDKPIYATKATAALLPLVIEDALKIGVTRDKKLIDAFLLRLESLILPIDYHQWTPLPLDDSNAKQHDVTEIKLKFKPAGHILGSAYVEFDLIGKVKHRVVFSGDLGATYAPLLASPRSPYRADTLVIESTYGDKNHQGRKDRSKLLKQIIEKCVADNGVVLIPAFSIGRTQELLYEFENIIAKNQHNPIWQNIDIIVDSPMAAKFTQKYLQFQALWDSEAKRVVNKGRHPLDFEQLYTIDSHQDHLAVINYLNSRNKPAIVIAASGMCSGGRIMNYLKRFLSEPTADVLFVGYQAQGTPGRDIQNFGPKGGYVMLDDERIDIKAGVHTISGYSAHADQANLINFVKRMHHKPKHIRIVHGDDEAKQALADKYHQLLPDCNVEIGKA